MSTSPANRGRGNRAGLDRAQIITAARRMEPRTLTMQALADELGVDRKALNYHVTDRDSLRRLLAADTFARHLADVRIPADGDWRAACRALAEGMRQAIARSGDWVEFLSFSTQSELATIGPAEITAERMLAAGFDHITVSRAMHMLLTMCLGFARDAAMADAEGRHPQIVELRRALAATSTGYAALRDLVDAEVDNYGDAQFDFDVTAFLTAMQTLLPR